MTHNQLQWQELQETKQHNRATETEQRRHDIRQEDAAFASAEASAKAAEARIQAANAQFASIAESAQHNRASEANEQARIHVQSMDSQERMRSNLVNEQQGLQSLEEQHRHNVADEGLKYATGIGKGVANTFGLITPKIIKSIKSVF